MPNVEGDIRVFYALLEFVGGKLEFVNGKKLR